MDKINFAKEKINHPNIAKHISESLAKGFVSSYSLMQREPMFNEFGQNIRGEIRRIACLFYLKNHPENELFKVEARTPFGSYKKHDVLFTSGLTATFSQVRSSMTTPPSTNYSRNLIDSQPSLFDEPRAKYNEEDDYLYLQITFGGKSNQRPDFINIWYPTKDNTFKFIGPLIAPVQLDTVDEEFIPSEDEILKIKNVFLTEKKSSNE